MREHAQLVGSLIALAMIVGASLALTFHGMKDETLLAILATGAVGIANTIAGVKTQTTTPPGTTSITATTAAPLAPSESPTPSQGA